ncbi:MAG: DUF5301 domain-containing protein [Oscillospiraceae bacterium]|nr:DUF5301 domain-containing protein [Oscillospiraceae bacterium]
MLKYKSILGKMIDKKIRRILLDLLSVFLIVLIGVICFFNYLFPKAGAIQVPETENITSMTLDYSDSDTGIPISEQYYENLLEWIHNAEPTRIQPMNDHPAGVYYSILIEATDREYCYFVFEEGDRIYIELPYEGIYTTDMEFLSIVSQYYQL